VINGAPAAVIHTAAASRSGPGDIQQQIVRTELGIDR